MQNRHPLLGSDGGDRNLLLEEVDRHDLVHAQALRRPRGAAVHGDRTLAHLTTQEALVRERERQAEELVELQARSPRGYDEVLGHPV